MKYEVNEIEVVTDTVTEAGLRREHASLGGRDFLFFLECLIEKIMDSYDDEVGDKIILSIRLFGYRDQNFGITFSGITFNFDGWSYTINPVQ